MKFTMTTCHLNNPKHIMEEEEDRPLKSEAEVEQWCIDIIEDFNNTLRPNEEPRKFLYVEITDTGKSKNVKHQWGGKINLVTMSGGYDKYKCKICGAIGKNFTLEFNPQTKKKCKEQ